MAFSSVRPASSRSPAELHKEGLLWANMMDYTSHRLRDICFSPISQMALNSSKCPNMPSRSPSNAANLFGFGRYFASSVSQHSHRNNHLPTCSLICTPPSSLNERMVNGLYLDISSLGIAKGFNTTRHHSHIHTLMTGDAIFSAIGPSATNISLHSPCSYSYGSNVGG